MAIGEDTRRGKVDDSLAEVEVEEQVDSKKCHKPLVIFIYGPVAGLINDNTVSLRTFLFRLPRRDVLQR